MSYEELKKQIKLRAEPSRVCLPHIVNEMNEGTASFFPKVGFGKVGVLFNPVTRIPVTEGACSQNKYRLGPGKNITPTPAMEMFGAPY